MTLEKLNSKVEIFVKSYWKNLESNLNKKLLQLLSLSKKASQRFNRTISLSYNHGKQFVECRNSISYLLIYNGSPSQWKNIFCLKHNL